MVIRSVILVAVSLAVCLVVYLAYKVTLVHWEMQDFSREVEAVRQQVDQLQSNVRSSGHASSVVELSRVLTILDEISSDASAGPVRDQAESLKREVLALIHEMGGSLNLTADSGETVIKDSTPAEAMTPVTAAGPTEEGVEPPPEAEPEIRPTVEAEWISESPQPLEAVSEPVLKDPSLESE
jgi:hypothetical protein